VQPASFQPGDAARFVGQPPVLEIRGRIDSTVKIRGFKVPKKLEATLLAWIFVGWCRCVFFCRVLRKGHDVS